MRMKDIPPASARFSGGLLHVLSISQLRSFLFRNDLSEVAEKPFPSSRRAFSACQQSLSGHARKPFRWASDSLPVCREYLSGITGWL